MATVVLQLVLFLSCTAAWSKNEFSDAVTLPHSDWGLKSQDDGRTWVVVNVLSNGQMFVAGSHVEGDELERLLRAETVRFPASEVGLLVRADRRVAYGRLSPIFIAAVRSRVCHVNFAIHASD